MAATTASQVIQTAGGDEWPVAEPQQKRFKIFMAGPPGCFKTRAALALADNGDRQMPATAVIDTEFGTQHYAGEFAFRRKESFDPGEIYRSVKGLVKNPGNITTLIFDSFSVYYDALSEEWVEKFQRRELTSPGNKGEYYTMQPRDYVHVNRDAGKLVRMMLNCDLNVICTCQVKAEWENLKVVGSVFDGWKRLPYYFDIYIFVEEWKKPGGTMGWKAYIKGKDRTGSLQPGQKIEWENAASIAAYLTEKFGQKLSEMPKAASYDPDTDKKVSVVVEADAKTAEVKAADAKTPEVKTATAEVKASAKKTAVKEPAKEPAKEAATSTKPAADPTGSIPSETVSNDVEPGPGLNVSPVSKNLLVEIVRLKNACKIQQPEVWKQMVAKYADAKGQPLASATGMLMWQAEDFIRTLTRMLP